MLLLHEFYDDLVHVRDNAKADILFLKQRILILVVCFIIGLVYIFNERLNR